MLMVHDSFLDFVPEVRETVNDALDIVPGAVDYVEKKYESIVKKYNEGYVEPYQRPVPSNVWWFSWLPSKHGLDWLLKYGTNPKINETINEGIDRVEEE